MPHVPVASVELAPYLECLAYLVATLIVAKILDWMLARHRRVLAAVYKRELTPAELSRYAIMRRVIVAVVLFLGIGFALTRIPQVSTLANGMLASAGITALVVGLAARSPLANFVSGLILTFSQPIRVGDYISVDDSAGTVEEMRLTYTFIRTADNRRILIPNEQLASKVINNYTLVDSESSVGVDVQVPADAPIAEVCEAVLDSVADLEGLLPGHPPTLEVTAVEVESVSLRLTLWAETRPQAGGIAATARRRIAERLQATGHLGGAKE
jgi:small-conductance mechanosensitive channel